jgi:hypothetical protein
MKIIALLLILSGCATGVQVTKFKSAECASPTTPEVLLQGEKPTKEYDKLALVSANNKNNGNIEEPEMFEALKKQAGAMCADAILVQSIEDTPGFLKQIKVIRAVAVKYKN